MYFEMGLSLCRGSVPDVDSTALSIHKTRSYLKITVQRSKDVGDVHLEENKQVKCWIGLCAFPLAYVMKGPGGRGEGEWIRRLIFGSWFSCWGYSVWSLRSGREKKKLLARRTTSTEKVRFRKRSKQESISVNLWWKKHSGVWGRKTVYLPPSAQCERWIHHGFLSFLIASSLSCHTAQPGSSKTPHHSSFVVGRGGFQIALCCIWNWLISNIESWPVLEGHIRYGHNVPQ